MKWKPGEDGKIQAMKIKFLRIILNRTKKEKAKEH